MGSAATQPAKSKMSADTPSSGESDERRKSVQDESIAELRVTRKKRRCWPIPTGKRAKEGMVRPRRIGSGRKRSCTGPLWARASPFDEGVRFSS